MKQLIDVKKLTDKKFLNLYEATYKLEDGSTTPWNFASRKPLNNINDMNKVAQEKKPDAVNIVTYYHDSNNVLHFLLIKEYRSPFNAYFISFPAGLVENGETVEEAAIREVKEEIGGEAILTKEIIHFASTSAGVSNEANAFVSVEVNPILHKQQLEKTEDITVLDMTASEVDEMIEEGKETFELSTLLFLKLNLD
jgi:ADP-ribose pyrophosphatase